MSDQHGNQPEKPEPRWGWWMLGISIAVLLVLAGIAFLQYWVVENHIMKTGTDEVTRFGVSGDFFGFANAVFSALAFAMIIVTLWMQKHELGLQREEIEHTRKELKGQKEEMKQQNASLRRQTFENTFFGMLAMHSQIVDAIKSPTGTPTQGRGAFAALVADLKNKSRKGTTAAHPEEVSVDSYNVWYRSHEAEVGHYFRTLYNMMRYIHEYGGEEKKMYARLLRAQLSSNELKLLFCNGLGEYGKEKFKPLIERYALLKHFRYDKALMDLKDQYDPSAFGQETESD